MKSTTTFFLYQTVRTRLHLLVILACVGLALLGHMPDSRAGWFTGTGTAYGITTGHRRCSNQQRTVVWHHAQRSVRVAILRSVVLGLWWYGSGKQWPMWLICLPWATWGWRVLGLYWPWMREQAEWRALLRLIREVERLVLILALSWPLRMGLRLMLGQLSFTCDLPAMNTSWGLGASVVCKSKTPSVSVVADENDGYTATLNGNFTLRVAGDDPFRKRLLILFLRLLEAPGQSRGSRRTRDGRTPFVRQQDLETAFGVPQPNISRWERYWLKGDWRRLLSLHTAEVLTLELQAQIVHVFAQFPWWGVEKVYQHLQEQDVTVSHRQVRQAAEESGWSLLRKELRKRYHLTAESFYPRDDWLVSQLLAQVQALLKKLETGNGLTPQEQTRIIDLQTLSDEIGVAETSPPLKTLPLLLRLERVLFGSWELVTDEQVRCIYCNSTQVARKSRKPRIKRYYDNEGNEQTIEVFRYYCHNPDCEKKTFTNLPPNLVPYSPYRMETHLMATQMYAWGYSTYRRTAAALEVAPITVYRWVSALGGELLPVAALFGVVRSSGVVGVDEKWVKVPKNNKPEGKRKEWMYVYLAVDVYTYDLLHIAIYPYLTKASAKAFLLELRAKGYKPRVIITDLRRDYKDVVAKVFVNTQHHECIFHALKWIQREVKEIYGTDYKKEHPEAVELKENIYAIFQCKDKRTSQKRYEGVMKQRQKYVEQEPKATAIFDTLERHWPKLINAMGSKIIPKTNNTVELVIRRFDQHYQNFCGFENIDTAQNYLAVFELVYRFTPFAKYNKKDKERPPDQRIGGKCPLELAGYDVLKLPISRILRGRLLNWPNETLGELVPNV